MFLLGRGRNPDKQIYRTNFVLYPNSRSDLWMPVENLFCNSYYRRATTGRPYTLAFRILWFWTLMCRGDHRSPLLFIIKQNLVYRTQWVLNSVCGGADPHAPAPFACPKGGKGTAQTPRRLWCGSQKLAPIQVSTKLLVSAKTTVSTSSKLNFYFRYD